MKEKWFDCVADVTVTVTRPITPLHVTAFNGRLKVVEPSLKHGDPHAKNEPSGGFGCRAVVFCEHRRRGPAGGDFTNVGAISETNLIAAALEAWA